MSQKDEEKAVRNFIIIFIVVLLIAVGIYFFTKLVVNKEEGKTSNEEAAAVEIDNSKAIVGTMLNKVEDNYYVLLYKSDDDNSITYSNLKTDYDKKKEKLPVYFVDLSNKLNEKYYDKDNTNYTASDINDLRFGDITLLEVKDKKIVKSFDSVDKIKKAWKLN